MEFLFFLNFFTVELLVLFEFVVEALFVSPLFDVDDEFSALLAFLDFFTVEFPVLFDSFVELPVVDFFVAELSVVFVDELLEDLVVFY